MSFEVSYVALAGSKWNHRRAQPRSLILSLDSCGFTLGSISHLGRTFLQSRVLFLFLFLLFSTPSTSCLHFSVQEPNQRGEGRIWEELREEK